MASDHPSPAEGARDRRHQAIGRLLAYVLRHNPGAVEISLDAEGWTDAKELLKALRKHRGLQITLKDLKAVVDSDDKQRYTLREGRIRANQGHSLKDVDAIGAEPQPAPAVLYHGTTTKRWEAIQASGGLQPMQRHHVHLSPDVATAWRVASRRRRETPILLTIDAKAMEADGHQFYCSDNGVWLVDTVPLAYLTASEDRPEGA